MTENSDESSNVPIIINWSEIDIKETVGKGSFGVVHRALWGGMEVAVKKSEGWQKTLENEAKLLSRMSHPNIVHLFGTSQHKSSLALVLEYADKGSLDSVFHSDESGPIDPVSFGLQCAQSLKYLHSKGVVHRDIKTANILAFNNNIAVNYTMKDSVAICGQRFKRITCKLTDFGTASVIQPDMWECNGTFAYMAPEVFDGRGYTEKCDVYSFGITFWELYCQRKPFKGIKTRYQLMLAIKSGERPPIEKYCPNFVKDLLNKCWATEPNERPSMEEVEQKLQKLYEFYSNNGLYEWRSRIKDRADSELA